MNPFDSLKNMPPAGLLVGTVIILILIIAGITHLLQSDTETGATNLTNVSEPKTLDTEPKARICTESDLGKNIFEKGTIAYDSVNASDSCTNSSLILELYCKDGQIMNESIDCPAAHHCKDGACVEKPEEIPTCVDSDEGSDQLTSGFVMYADKNYSDTCVMIDQVKEYYCKNGTVRDTNFICEPGFQCVEGRCLEMPANCTDTDNGKEMFKKGMVSVTKGYFLVTKETDSCVDENNVREYFCSDSKIGSQIMECEEDYECDEGACIYSSCEDSDGGSNLLKAGTTKKGSVSESDSCESTYNVIEYYCTDNKIQSTTNTCPTGYWCSADKCVQEPDCYDTDSGNDIYNQGTVTKGSETHPDSCDGKILTEYYCDGKAVRSQDVDCTGTGACSSGACVVT
jgi:hypothetical protein